MRKIIYALFAFFCLVLASACSVFPSQKSHDTIIRVCIADNRDSVSLALKGRYKIYGVSSGNVLMEGPYCVAKVTATAGGIQIDKKEIKDYGVKVKVVRDANIYVENKRFRGDIDIMRKENGNLMVINYVGLEDYLYGVLYHEVSHRWPMEALKAQAIVARTFALYQIGQNKLQPYDVTNDIYSQVYGGRTSEKWSTSRAVDLTRGKVLTYKAAIFPAYYHATCGGHTEDASNLWNIDMPPLVGVDCGFCRDSPHYEWKKEIPLWMLETDLKDNSYRIGKISSVSVLSKNKSGRVDKLEIKDEGGGAVTLTGKDFRQIIGPNELRSTRFDAAIKWNTLVLSGSGWGHGAGMCQWGAFGMARKHKHAEEILKYYYPGAEIMAADRLPSKP